LKSAQPVYRYSARPGTLVEILLIGIQLAFAVLACLVSFSWQQLLLWLVLQLAVLAGLFLFIRLSPASFPELVYVDGQWALQSSHADSLQRIKPDPQSTVLPVCLVLAYRDEVGRKRRLLIWKDVLGEVAFRQLCYHLQRYFFLLKKSQ
jgi:hypothetical protein